jgi:predicted O-methyltransferase YrrM
MTASTYRLPRDLVALLEELERFGRSNDETQADHRQKMLNLEPVTARLLHFILRSSRRKRILEIGTSNGYSTIWIAAAAESVGGEVVSIDRSSEKHKLARANLERAGLADRVELITNLAIEAIPSLAGEFDAVFFDADRVTAGTELELLLPRLGADVIIAADNAVSHPDEIAVYLETIRAFPDFWEFIVPIGKGLSLAYRQSSADRM